MLPEHVTIFGFVTPLVVGFTWWLYWMSSDRPTKKHHESVGELVELITRVTLAGKKQGFCVGDILASIPQTEEWLEERITVAGVEPLVLHWEDLDHGEVVSYGKGEETFQSSLVNSARVFSYLLTRLLGEEVTVLVPELDPEGGPTGWCSACGLHKDNCTCGAVCVGGDEEVCDNCGLDFDSIDGSDVCECDTCALCQNRACDGGCEDRAAEEHAKEEYDADHKMMEEAQNERETNPCIPAEEYLEGLKGSFVKSWGAPTPINPPQGYIPLTTATEVREWFNLTGASGSGRSVIVCDVDGSIDTWVAERTDHSEDRPLFARKKGCKAAWLSLAWEERRPQLLYVEALRAQAPEPPKSDVTPPAATWLLPEGFMKPIDNAELHRWFDQGGRKLYALEHSIGGGATRTPELLTASGKTDIDRDPRLYLQSKGYSTWGLTNGNKILAIEELPPVWKKGVDHGIGESATVVAVWDSSGRAESVKALGKPGPLATEPTKKGVWACPEGFMQVSSKDILHHLWGMQCRKAWVRMTPLTAPELVTLTNISVNTRAVNCRGLWFGIGEKYRELLALELPHPSDRAALKVMFDKAYASGAWLFGYLLNALTSKEVEIATGVPRKVEIKAITRNGEVVFKDSPLILTTRPASEFYGLHTEEIPF